VPWGASWWHDKELEFAKHERPRSSRRTKPFSDYQPLYNSNRRKSFTWAKAAGHVRDFHLPVPTSHFVSRITVDNTAHKRWTTSGATSFTISQSPLRLLKCPTVQLPFRSVPFHNANLQIPVSPIRWYFARVFHISLNKRLFSAIGWSRQ
jgi:hypothetical protein